MKITLILIIITCFCTNLKGQYRINKEKYNSSEYFYQPGDPYNPLICGVASYIIPGLGQMVAGETGRGLIFTGAFFGSVVVAGVGAIGSLDKSNNNPEATILLVAGITGAAVSMIGSIVDAVKVAKVNNLAYRDKKRTSYNFNVQPYYTGNAALVGQSVGLKVGVRF